jgi:hypothetical protein
VRSFNSREVFMRKVGIATTDIDQYLEGKVGSYARHMDSCGQQFNREADSTSLAEALKGDNARSLAQYNEVVRVLTEIVQDQTEDKIRLHLSCWAAAAVSQMRSADTPRWQTLATATILETLLDCLKVDAGE